MTDKEEDMHDETAERALREVTERFFGKPSKRPRQKPHRCMRCGRVTRFIFCPPCNKARADERRSS